MVEIKYNSIHIPTEKFHAFANLPPSVTGLARKPPCCPLLVSWKVTHVVGPTIGSRETLQGGACCSTRESSYGVWRVLININTSIAGFPSNVRNWTTAQGRKNTNPSLVYFVVTFPYLKNKGIYLINSECEVHLEVLSLEWCVMSNGGELRGCWCWWDPVYAVGSGPCLLSMLQTLHHRHSRDERVQTSAW